MIDDNDDLKPSKQQQKRDAEAAQALGKELVELPAAKLTELCERLDLPEKLQAALIEYGRIKAHEARRRHLQYIGKLMRSIELESVQAWLTQFRQRGQTATAVHHLIEGWRDRLLSEGETALNAFLLDYPTADAKQLRQLIASAQREAARQQPPRSARLLFKHLRGLMAG